MQWVRQDGRKRLQDFTAKAAKYLPSKCNSAVLSSIQFLHDSGKSVDLNMHLGGCSSVSHFSAVLVSGTQWQICKVLSTYS